MNNIKRHLPTLQPHWLYAIILYLLLFSYASMIIGCSNPEKEVPKLVKELSHRESHVRNKSALRLAGFGPEAKKAVPALIRLLRDKNRGVQSSAAYALRAIGTKKALKAIEIREKQGR